MNSDHRMLKLTVVVMAFVAVVGMAGPVAADATSSESPNAVVSMGDSFISGEAGRWEGNSSRSYGDRRGTDRAAYKRRGWWRYDRSLVYSASDGNGCHRSDVAPVLSSEIAVERLINLACSGAATKNLIRAENGGVGQNGEPSQADQLAVVAQSYDVEMIVVSIGGNDLGFGSIIVDCAIDYLTSTSRRPRTCNEDQQQNIDSEIDDAMASVGLVLDEIRAVMGQAGYGTDDYRLVLQSYASPVPSGDEFRYGESKLSRTIKGRCPFWNADATWARDSFVPQLSSGLRAVSDSRGIEFLDMQDALDGREACSKTTAQGRPDNAEWSRFVSLGIAQGDMQESLHPNAYGQRANGSCLALLFDATPGSYGCNNVADAGPDKMVLSSLRASMVGR
ncbi:MAG: GDSL-type esterase/lipase family protein [Acidimicrobiales bacterium]